jgi:hypothetical protein
LEVLKLVEAVEAAMVEAMVNTVKDIVGFLLIPYCLPLFNNSSIFSAPGKLEKL